MLSCDKTQLKIDTTFTAQTEISLVLDSHAASTAGSLLDSTTTASAVRPQEIFRLPRR